MMARAEEGGTVKIGEATIAIVLYFNRVKHVICSHPQ